MSRIGTQTSSSCLASGRDAVGRIGVSVSSCFTFGTDAVSGIGAHSYHVLILAETQCEGWECSLSILFCFWQRCSAMDWILMTSLFAHWQRCSEQDRSQTSSSRFASGRDARTGVAAQSCDVLFLVEIPISFLLNGPEKG